MQCEAGNPSLASRKLAESRCVSAMPATVPGTADAADGRIQAAGKPPKSSKMRRRMFETVTRQWGRRAGLSWRDFSSVDFGRFCVYTCVVPS